MVTLESIVLPLPESQSLAAAGITLDTALVWVIPVGIMGLPIPYVSVAGDSINAHFKCVPAPVLSELLDAIRERVGNPLDERNIILAQDGRREVPCRAEVRYPGGDYRVAYNDTDLLAACALLREVSHA